MDIHVVSATSTAPTGLAAFDKALNYMGVANYNLIELSSVIPAKSKVIVHDGALGENILPGKWGDKLYVVLAEARVITPNVEAWSGIGWVQDKTTKEGLFVEHHGNSKGSVRGDIEDSLNSMMEYRKEHDFGSIKMRLDGITCESHPVSAVTMAIYQAEDWRVN